MLLKIFPNAKDPDRVQYLPSAWASASENGKVKKIAILIIDKTKKEGQLLIT